MHHPAQKLHVPALAPVVSSPARPIGLLPWAVVIAAACGVLALVLFAPAPAVDAAAAASSHQAASMGVDPRDPSVPDAASVLAHREPSSEAAAPTF